MRIALIAVVLLASGCKSAPPPVLDSPPPPPPRPQSIERMAPFASQGFTLAGAEYWPYRGTADIKYPDEVLWGFYPEAGVAPPGEADPNPATARPEAVACAQTAFAALQAFLASPPAKLREVVARGEARGVVPKFYLWVNDYGEAATPYPPGVRPARLWYWKRKEPAPPKPPGYWKWEATLTQDGRCEVPVEAQIDQYLTELRGALERGDETLPR